MGKPWEDGAEPYHDGRLREQVDRARQVIFDDRILGEMFDKTPDAVRHWRTSGRGLPALSRQLGDRQARPGSTGYFDNRAGEYTVVTDDGCTVRFVDSRTGTIVIRSPHRYPSGEILARGNLVPESTGPGSPGSIPEANLVPRFTGTLPVLPPICRPFASGQGLTRAHWADGNNL